VARPSARPETAWGRGLAAGRHSPSVQADPAARRRAGAPVAVGRSPGHPPAEEPRSRRGPAEANRRNPVGGPGEADSRRRVLAEGGSFLDPAPRPVRVDSRHLAPAADRPRRPAAEASRTAVGRRAHRRAEGRTPAEPEADRSPAEEHRRQSPGVDPRAPGAECSVADLRARLAVSQSPEPSRNLAGHPAEDRSLAGRPAEDRSLAGPRAGDQSLAEDRPAGDQSLADRPAEDRSLAGRPAEDRSLAGRPAEDRSLAGRPAEDRSLADRPAGDQSLEPVPAWAHQTPVGLRAALDQAGAEPGRASSSSQSEGSGRRNADNSSRSPPAKGRADPRGRNIRSIA
jgi:hypothetical protein